MNEGAFACGTIVVPLQSLRSTDFLVPAIADALGFPLAGQESPLVQLGRYLSDKDTLIILDNFEHLLDAADQLVTLISYTPLAKYLITSREALNLQEEWLYRVDGLAFPTESHPASAVQAYDAVQLFNERAQRVYPDFAPAEEVDAIVRICQLVGGMPLALELAAAWRKTLSCQEIAAEIQGGLKFLTTNLRNVSHRHRSIQTVFEQTWRRLSGRERDVFMRLSVFQGGFRREAAVKVMGASLPVLSSLVDKSLLVLDINGRYQIHELLRQYAAEQLEGSASDAHQAQLDHADYYIQFLHRRSADVSGGRQREALLEIKEELANIRIAWLWAVAHEDAEALRMGSQPLGLYYQYLGGYMEGLLLFSRATEVLGAQPQSEPRDLALLGTLMYQTWYYLRFGRLGDAEACMAQSKAIYQRLDVPPLPGHLTDPNAPLGFVALTRGDYATAVRYADQVRQVAEAEQHPINRQFAYHLLAEANVGLGEYETAQTFAQQAYAQALMSGDRWFMAYILNNLGRIAVALGDNRMGKTYFHSSYEIRQTFDDPEGMALALINLGNLALKDRSFAEAEDHYRRSLTIYQDINDKGGLAAANCGLGIVSCEQGTYLLSQGFFRQALHLAVQINYRPVLFDSLVSIAGLLWKAGQRTRPLVLLAFTIHHPATGHETRSKARARLMRYQEEVPPELLTAAMAEGKASDQEKLTAELLHQLSLPLVPTEEEAPSPSGSAQSLVEPLTPRELDVLRLLCEGLTNQAIADELVLAIGTVKFYTAQIYGKLGVRNRVAAVVRSRELRLLHEE